MPGPSSRNLFPNLVFDYTAIPDFSTLQQIIEGRMGITKIICKNCVPEVEIRAQQFVPHIRDVHGEHSLNAKVIFENTDLMENFEFHRGPEMDELDKLEIK